MSLSKCKCFLVLLLTDSLTLFILLSKKILLIPGTPRDLHIPDIPLPAAVKQEPTTSKKSAKTLFSVTKPAAKKVEVKQKVELQTDQEPSVKVEVVKPKKTSPEEGKNNAKTITGKKAQLKNQKPVQKGSISSFFNNKPGPSKPVEKPKPEVEKPKVETMLIDEDSEEEEEVLKRKATPEKQIVKKVKAAKEKKKQLKKSANNKRSRIRVMENSSDEEVQDKNEDSDEPDTKFIKFDREFTPEKSATEKSPVKEPENVTTKRKAKRWVKKRFQTDDGFMRTENVLEEYSASEAEAENDENKKKNSPPKPKLEKKSSEKKQPAAKSAQASKITSFFTKK